MANINPDSQTDWDSVMPNARPARSKDSPEGAKAKEGEP